MSRAAVVTLAVVATLLAGCGGLPREGPVRSGPERDPGEPVDAAVDYTPEGPRADASPVEVVGGFLQAMQATPLSTAVAREFLTDEASAEWAPEKATVVYGVYTLRDDRQSVQLNLTETARLDRRGEWLGDTSDGEGISRRLRLVRERGQWRIANPPDSLIVAQAYFETRFAQRFLHFFGRSAQVLVPEPVYVPIGEQAPTLLVRGLLSGPDREPVGLTRTFLPAGTELDDLSVLVDDDGTAEVPLTEDITTLDAQRLDLALAQIGWTLGQVPGVSSFRVTVDGAPLELPGQGIDHAVEEWPEFDPSVVWASQELFGLRADRLVAVSDQQARRVTGPAGTKDLVGRSFAVDLAARQVAAVSNDGSQVLVAARGGVSDSLSNDAKPDVVLDDTTDPLQPAWDLHGQLWVIDLGSRGAVIRVVGSGEPQQVNAPGISGRMVKAFAVSRDGTRLVAVLAGGGRNELVVARIVSDDDGTVRAVSPAQRIPVRAAGTGPIRDVAWRTPVSVMVLSTTAQQAQVRSVLVDGSTSPSATEPAGEVLDQSATRLVTGPSPSYPVYVESRRGRLLELAADGRWLPIRLGSDLGLPTFVG